jgi:arylsulfatase A-like enzyme
MTVWGMSNEYHQWLWKKGVTYSTTPRDDCPVVRTGMSEEHHQTTFCCEKASEFIEARATSSRPWLYSVNIFDPHHAFDPPADYLERYLERLNDIPLPNEVPGELDDKPPYQQNHIGPNSPYSGLTDYEHRLIRASYWAMGDLIDVQVGKLLEALDRSGQRDNTIVVYMSDHGEMLGDHGLYEKGAFFYEPAVHIPLMVSWPGVIQSRRSSALVELTDLAQTFLDAAALPHHPGMQGQSLWSLLQGQTDTHRGSVYSEYYNAKPLQTDPTAQVTMVRTETHKLVADHTHKGGELYDLVNDPSETHNLWSDPHTAAVKLSLLFELCNRMAFTVDPLPIRRSPW